MSREAMTEVLRAWMKRENLVLCRSNDTAFALDGEREAETLREIVVLVDDATAVAEFDLGTKTAEVPSEVVDHLRALSAAA